MRRRPSGTPSPLPHHIQRSGFIWPGIAVVAAGAAVAIFAGGLIRWAVEVTVIDDTVTRRIVQGPVPGLTGIARVIAEAGAAPAIVLAAYALLLALIAARRFPALPGPAAPGPGITRFRAPDPGTGFSATWFDVFPGGCVTIALRPATKVAAVGRGLPRQVPAIVGYVSRASLQLELALRSGGRLRLDPSR